MKWEHGKVGADCPPIVDISNIGGLPLNFQQLFKIFEQALSP
jgi:hypothetical protein